MIFGMKFTKSYFENWQVMLTTFKEEVQKEPWYIGLSVVLIVLPLACLMCLVALTPGGED